MFRLICERGFKTSVRLASQQTHSPNDILEHIKTSIACFKYHACLREWQNSVTNGNFEIWIELLKFVKWLTVMCECVKRTKKRPLLHPGNNWVASYKYHYVVLLTTQSLDETEKIKHSDYAASLAHYKNGSGSHERVAAASGKVHLASCSFTSTVIAAYSLQSFFFRQQQCC